MTLTYFYQLIYIFYLVQYDVTRQLIITELITIDFHFLSVPYRMPKLATINSKPRLIYLLIANRTAILHQYGQGCHNMKAFVNVQLLSSIAIIFVATSNMTSGYTLRCTLLRYSCVTIFSRTGTATLLKGSLWPLYSNTAFIARNGRSCGHVWNNAEKSENERKIWEHTGDQKSKQKIYLH